MWLRTVVLLTAFAAQAWAEDSNRDFRYYVFDQTKNTQIDYEYGRDFIIYPQNPPRLVFSTQHRIQGCAQKSFVYRDTVNIYTLSDSEFRAFLKIIRKMDLGKLRYEKVTSCKMGLLDIGSESRSFNNPLGSPIRNQLDSAVMALMNGRSAIEHSEETCAIKSDLNPPIHVTVRQLLQSPSRFDGKRVRVTGYYHSEFESSSLTAQKGDDFDPIWIAGPSSFANPSDINWTDDGNATIEGTFVKGLSGHFGGYQSEIQRLTKFISLDPPLLPPPPANQSSKRRG